MSVEQNVEIAPVAAFKQVNDEWRQWIAKTLLSGYTPESIARSMRTKNFREQDIQQEIQQAVDSPYMKAAAGLGKRIERNEWLLNTYGELRRRSKDPHGIDRCSKLEPEEFFEKYFFANKPVIMTDAVDDWPAFQLWGLEYFKSKFGDEPVVTQFNRSASADSYGPGPSEFTRQMALSEYIDLIVEHSPTNEFYLGRRDSRKCRPLVKKLTEDIRQWPYTGPMEQGALWLGPAGTVTPLHFDAANILMVQMVGRKRIFLAPPYDGIHLHSDSSVNYSKFNPAAPDYEAFPKAKQVSFIEIIQNPKDVLFIPIGWWHMVAALDISVTMTFENFVCGD